MPFISFIIPIYNGEKYLAACIDSILNQDFRDFEILLMDDHSIDRSSKICEDYSTHEEIRYIRLESNNGPGHARNIGMSQAKGEYLFFVDSDDMIEGSEIGPIAEYLKSNPQIQLLYLNDALLSEQGKVLTFQTSGNIAGFKCFDKYKFVEYILEHNMSVPAMWRFIIKASFLKMNGIISPKSYMGEDIAVTVQAISLADYVAAWGRNVYFYRQAVAGSLTETGIINDRRSLESLVISLHSIFQFADNNSFPTEMAPLVRNTIRMLSYTLFYIFFCSFPEALPVEDFLEAYEKEFGGMSEEAESLIGYVKRYGMRKGFYQYRQSLYDAIRLASKERKIFIAPATKRNFHIYHKLRSCGIEISGILDNQADLRKKTYRAYPIYSFNQIENDSKSFVILFFHRLSVVEAMKKQLMGLGLKEGKDFICIQ